MISRTTKVVIDVRKDVREAIWKAVGEGHLRLGTHRGSFQANIFGEAVSISREFVDVRYAKGWMVLSAIGAVYCKHSLAPR